MGRRFCVLASGTFFIVVILLLAELSAGASPKVRVGLPDFTSSSVPFEIAPADGLFLPGTPRRGYHPHVVRGLGARAGCKERRFR